MLYRLFPFDPDAEPSQEGGALHVPRTSQGGGRHDNPDVYGAMYLSRSPVSVVAERIRRFTDRPIRDSFFLWAPQLRYAIASIDDSRLVDLVDLDDPGVLSRRDLRPSRVATRDRATTQELALAIFEEEALGFEWWSTIEASWINVTLFAERVLPRLRVAADPEPISVTHPVLREAADAVGVELGA